jgi:hypothetical protein
MRKAIQPLGFFERLALPLLKLTNRGMLRVELDKRIAATEQAKEHQRAERELKRQLKKEAKLYESLMINCWARRREAHFTRRLDVSTEHKGHVGKVGKVQHVRFWRIFTKSEQIHFKIMVNKKTIWGATKDMLPYGVDVADLGSEEALFELGHACGREVKAEFEEFRKGAWITVNRLVGFDGIPLRVNFPDVLEHTPQDISDGPVILGIGEHRKVHMVTLADHPHWLVGGSSGGGKSNIINHIICSLMRYSDADDLKFILIDLKQMEFGWYKDAPHLFQPVVFEAADAAQVLEDLLKEVYRRASLMRDKAKQLSAWNKQNPSQRMPRLVVIIDEFAELMASDFKKQIRKLTTRITNLGRAVGIHMIVATQRPAVQVIPNDIKINMPLIIAARVQNTPQSNVILGTGDAADLPLLPGRMIYISGSKMETIQTPYVSEDDVVGTVRIARGRAMGFIRLVDNEPIIVPEGILAYIVDCLQGSLSSERLSIFFRDYGVPGPSLGALLSDVIRYKEVTAFHRRFIVEKRGRGWGLVEVFAQRWDRGAEDEFVIPTDHTIARLTAPRPLLLGPGPMPEPVSPPEPVIIDVEAEPVEEKSFEQILSRFIAECCMVGKTATATAGELYESYSQYCREQGLEVTVKKEFGLALKDRGFVSYRTNSARFWRGIGLIEVHQPEIA